MYGKNLTNIKNKIKRSYTVNLKLHYMLNSELLHYVQGTKKNILLNVLFRWFALLMNILISFSVARLLNDLFIGQPPNYFLYFISVLSFWLVKFLFERRAELYGHQLSESVKIDLRQKFFKKIISIGPSYNQKISTSKIMQLAGEGIEQLQTYYSGFMPQLFYSIAATLTMVVISFFINIKTSLILLLLSPIIPLVIVIGLRIAKKILGKYWKSYFSLGHIFLDNIQGLTMLKSYDLDAEKHLQMNLKAEDFRKKTMSLLRSQLNSINMMDIIAFGGLAAGIVTALYQLKNHQMSMFVLQGDTRLLAVFFIILLCYDFFVPLRILGSLFHVAMNGIWASTFIKDVLDAPENTQANQTIENLDYDIQLKEVSFSYDKNKIISHLNMEFPHKKITSIVGQSGCGKSTIANLLIATVTGYQGKIIIGGIENKFLTTENRMMTINMLTHNPYFFKGTVKENLHIANPNATNEEIDSLLRDVHLYDFLYEQQGLETYLSENAGNFSGGQKQRLAIARTLLQDPEILIFDEATSNIDEESEEIIMKLIRKISCEKTIIIISHRLSNVKLSDNIYYMSDGEVKEQGTHEELINAQKDYAILYQHQKHLEKYAK